MSIYVKTNEEQEAEYEYDFIKERYPILLEALRKVANHEFNLNSSYIKTYQELKDIAKEALKQVRAEHH